MNTTSKTIINQNQLVIGYLKRNSRRNLTSEQICEGVNQQIRETSKNKKTRTQLTVTQISKCLNRFSEKNMVKQIDKDGTFSNGRKAVRWGYLKP